MQNKNYKQLPVKYSNRGLANYYGDHIKINQNLKSNKKLRDYIIKHELGHSTSFDLHYEISDGFKLIKNPKIALSLLSFYFLHPSTWTDLIPIQINKEGITYDFNQIILYFVMIILVFFLIKMF